MTRALARRTQSGSLYQPPEFNPRQMELLTRTICPGATRDQLELFVYVCKRTGLDPFAKQIYGIMRKQKEGDAWVPKLVIQTGIDGYRLTAHRTGQYAGQDDTEFGPTVQSDGIEHPEWAKTTVYKLFGNNRVAFTGMARWKEYRQMAKGRDDKPYLTGKWSDMPFNQLAKCSEALALRKGFPAELGGVYVEDELPPADAPETMVTIPAAATGKDVIAAPTKTYPITEAHRAFGKALLARFKDNKEEAANELERITTYNDEKGRLHKGVRSIKLLSAEDVAEFSGKWQAEQAKPAGDAPPF